MKLVAGRETGNREFAAATRLLRLVVAGVCHESAVSTLSQEVAVLRDCVTELRQTRSNGCASAAGADSDAKPVLVEHGCGGPGLVERVILHLQRHYQAPELSLVSVAKSLGCNPRYLTTRFTRAVGDRMHTYLLRLRVAHSCRLLLQTSAPIKEIAYSSGFRGNASLARAFRRHVGVSPGEYRRIFRDA